MTRIKLLFRLFQRVPARRDISRLAQWEEFIANEYRAFASAMSDRGVAFLPFESWLEEPVGLATLAA